MPILTRSLSATSSNRPSNRPYLTPRTPPPTNPRALTDMTPLPSLFDKMTEVAKRGKRSTSLQLKSGVDNDPSASSSIPGAPGVSLSGPVGACDVRQPSDAPIEIEGELEPVVHQTLATGDRMDFEDTPIVFSEPVYPNPPPVPIVPPPTPAPVSLPVREEVATGFPPPYPFDTYPGPPIAPPPTDHGFLPSEFTNSATSLHQATHFYYNPPSTSTNLGSHFPPQGQAPSQPPQVSEELPQLQIPEHDTVYLQYQYPTFPPPTYPIPSPVLSGSGPIQSTMQPAVPPVLAQSLPSFTAIPTYPGLNPQQQGKNWLCPPSALAETYRRPTLVPQVQPQPGLENTVWWFHPRPRVPRWRVREIERQREMDRIAEPYVTRLREVSRQKKVDAEARAFAEQQRADQAEDEPESSLRHSSREDEKKARKELKKIERQQRSEEKRQARKDAREERRRRKAAEDTSDLRGVQETEGRRKSKRSGRSKPYSIPPPETRSPRRMHAMPGGFDSDDLTSDQTSLTSDALWKGLRSAVDMGYRLWMQC